MLPLPLFALVLGIASSYAADSGFFSDGQLRKDRVQTVLEHKPAPDADCRRVPTGPIETTTCDYETVESVNDDLYGQLHDLVQTPFFKYFRVDLYRECPFWQENGFCMNRECGITTVDESEIPERWRAAALSQLEMPPSEERTALPGCFYRDSDFCFLDDLSEGDYIDLSMNPERFTGYVGPAAWRVWKSIYEENCFGLSESESELSLLENPGRSSAPVSLPDTMLDPFKNGEGRAPADEPECLEKRIYYKIISGLHASISTHICTDNFNQTTGEWGPNLQCFVNRIASHPERLQYIYLNTVLLLRAVRRIEPYLAAYDYCSTGTHEDDQQTLDKVNEVLRIAKVAGGFDETVLFRGENANVLKQEFKTHFRNVTRIMDCVGCDKCRLWGKVQTTGLATAFKILFELDEKTLNPKSNPHLLQRSEVVALINTLHRFSESLHAVNAFRRMWAEADEAESEELLREAERISATMPNVSPRPSTTAGIDERRPTMTIVNRLQHWLDTCKAGVQECVSVVGNSLRAIAKLFTVSQKGGGLTDEL